MAAAAAAAAAWGRGEHLLLLLLLLLSPGGCRPLVSGGQFELGWPGLALLAEVGPANVGG